MKNSLRILVCLFALGANSAAATWRYDGIERVVAVSDVHGDYGALVDTLERASIIDAELNWVGGNSHLVVVGDMLDRGPNSRKVMELMMALETQATAADGRVHVLIGNHESMLLTGDMRYVSDAEYAAFAGDEDAAERAAWRALFMERGNGNMKTLGASFEEKFPPGYFAMRRAFRAEGRYGAWLLEKNIIAVLDETAFVHGGLPPLIADVGLQAVNEDLVNELRDYVTALAVLTDAHVLLPTDSHYDYRQILRDYRVPQNATSELRRAVRTALAAQNSVLLGADGPLWYRSNVVCQELVEEHRLQRVLESIDAQRLVVGHTPTASRQVQQRFDGAMIEIDTGMLSSHYNGSGNALVIEGSDVFVVSQHGEVSIEVIEHARRVGLRAGPLSTEALTTLLVAGEVTMLRKPASTDGYRSGQSIATVSDGDHSVEAIFSEQRVRNVLPSVAAYRLDRLLGLQMVPVTVAREIEGKRGSLQFLPDRIVNEAERANSGQGAGASCGISDQWAAMYVFDSLIYNEGRAPQRMLYDESTWQLILSDHGDAFVTKKGRPRHLRDAKLAIGGGWQQALGELNDDVLQANFADVLDARRIKALAARRDELLENSALPD